jgi:hypothetical protein
VKAVSFVGSCHVGEHVYKLSSEHGKRAQCMMGAKNHAVVMPDANKEKSLDALVGAGFGAAGQRCMATSVAVLVGEANQWIPDIVAKAKTLKVNAGVEKGADLGPVISTQAKKRIEGFIEQGVKEGAKLELDGPQSRRCPATRKGNFIAPTVFSGVKPEHEIYKEEIFGPVLILVSVDYARRGDRPGEQEPVRQRHRHLHAVGRRGAQVPERDRRGPGGHQRADPGAGALLQLHRLARLQAGRPRPLRQAGDPVLHPGEDDHVAVVRRRDDEPGNPYDHQPEVAMKIGFVAWATWAIPCAATC